MVELNGLMPNTTDQILGSPDKLVIHRKHSMDLVITTPDKVGAP